MKYRLNIPRDHVILAVDPSVRALGLALLGRQGGGPYMRILTVYSGRLSVARACAAMYNSVELFCPLDKATDLIVEQPIIVDKWSDNKKDNIRKLQAAVQALQQRKPAATQAWYPTVGQWKGQLSKEVSAERTQEILQVSDIRIADPRLWNTYDHNAHDAAGLLVAYCKKQNWIEEIK